MKLISVAGYSRVYKREVNGLITAVKVMKLNDGDIDAIIKEVNTLKIIDHQNIVKMLGFNIVRSRIEIELEFFGKDLMDYHGGFSYKQSINYFSQLVSAVDFLHRVGIIHLDIKPANVLILGDKIKLCDFNCVFFHSKLKHKNFGTNICKPIENFIELSEGYLKEKLITFSGEKSCIYDYLTDVYALGIMLLFLLSGKILFYPDNKLEKNPPTKNLFSFIENQRLYLQNLDTNIDGQIIDILLQLFAPKRINRMTLSELKNNKFLNLNISDGKINKQIISLPTEINISTWPKYFNEIDNILRLNKMNYLIASTSLDITIRLYIFNEMNNINFDKTEISMIYKIAGILFNPDSKVSRKFDDKICRLMKKLDGFLFNDNPFLRIENENDITDLISMIKKVKPYLNING